MTREPDLRELVGQDLAPVEEIRLRRAHELLVAAGAPPELTPDLEHAPVPGRAPEPRIQGLPARRRGLKLTLALGFAAVTLVTGYWFGVRSDGFNTDFSVQMQATPAAPGASAVVQVGSLDAAGNWPLRMKVRGLPELGNGGYYELLLTRNGKPTASCGTFRVHKDTTEVRLNAPYRFTDYDGWVVTAHRHGKPDSKQPLLKVNTI
jgi:hypothetical protein